ncbi:MAG: hypothetical protein DMD82_03065 [Candidatus Rokuibacteriota bacterium]|nr:MAG: hypothetical protein DMD82_03065 [Candidatus Rokubacteria bacterium]
MRGTQRGLAAAVACLLTAGCGYSVTSNLPPHIRTVAVPIFANRTQEPAVENLISRAVVEAFTTNSGLRVANPEDADAILEGEIVGYQLQPLAFNQAANVREYRLVVTLNLRFKDVRTNELLLDEKGIQEKADFRAASDVAVSIASEQSALRQAATDIGRAIVNLAIDRF